jgi:hypothetical protein
VFLDAKHTGLLHPPKVAEPTRVFLAPRINFKVKIRTEMRFWMPNLLAYYIHKSGGAYPSVLAPRINLKL